MNLKFESKGERFRTDIANMVFLSRKGGLLKGETKRVTLSKVWGWSHIHSLSLSLSKLRFLMIAWYAWLKEIGLIRGNGLGCYATSKHSRSTGSTCISHLLLFLRVPSFMSFPSFPAIESFLTVSACIRSDASVDPEVILHTNFAGCFFFRNDQVFFSPNSPTLPILHIFYHKSHI